MLELFRLVQAALVAALRSRRRLVVENLLLGATTVTGPKDGTPEEVIGNLKVWQS